MLIILAANIVAAAVPTTYIDGGSVDSVFIGVNCDPIIPLIKTVTVAAVNANT